MHKINEDYIRGLPDSELKILFQQVVNELNKREIT